jgi:hypothetical protein
MGGWATDANAAGIQTRIHAVRDAEGQIVAIEASSLSPELLAEIRQRLNADEVFALLTLNVKVAFAAADSPAIAGSYTVRGHTLRFTPRYAFREGQAYRAMSRIGDVSFDFQQPARKATPPAEVTAVYPDVSVVPENLLRFYIEFSTPMSRGSAYEHVQLLDSEARPVELPFLELGEELWDPEQKRLTLIIDPGRIKRGVKPREDLGTVLQEGEKFTLVVLPTWLDAANRPLRGKFTKTIRVGPPIEQAIDPAQWKITPPAAGSHEPVTIDFPRALDHALLQRMIEVRTASGAAIEGEVTVSNQQRRWQMRTAHSWPNSKYEIVVDHALEDLVGNRIGRAFEVDQVGPITGQLQTDVVRLLFEITSPK